MDRFFDVIEQQQTSPSALATQLDAGLPALLVLKTNETRLHWSLLSGYRTDKRGKPKAWRLLNKNGKTELSHNEFLAAWNNDDFENYSLFIIPNDAKPKPTFPPPKGLSASIDLPVGEIPKGSRQSGPLAVATLMSVFGTTINNQHISGLVHLIEPGKDGTTPGELVAFLDKHVGVTRQSYENPKQLQIELNAGRPVILYLRTNGTRHWSVLTDYRTDRNGEFISWDFVQNGKRHLSVPHDQFIQDLSPMFPLILLKPTSQSNLRSLVASAAIYICIHGAQIQKKNLENQAQNDVAFKDPSLTYAIVLKAP